MNYHKADYIKNKSLLGLIVENKLAHGKGIGSSIGSAISDKFKSKATGIKRKLDPLNWISSVLGNGLLSKTVTTLAGRAFGRSDESISYFGGYKRKSKRDPFHTRIGPNQIQILKTGDSVADILAKIYNLTKKKYDEERLQRELANDFRHEQFEKSERQHHSLLEAIKKSKSLYVPDMGGVSKDQESDKDSGIMSTVTEMGLGGLAALAIRKFLSGLKNIAKRVGSLIKKGIKKIFDFAKEKYEKYKLKRKGITATEDGKLSKSQKYKESLSKKDIKNLENKGIKYDEKMQAWRKDGKLTKTEDVMKSLNKKPSLLKKAGNAISKTSTFIKESKIYKTAKGILPVFKKIGSVMKKVPGLASLGVSLYTAYELYDAIRDYEMGKITEDQLKKIFAEQIGSWIGGAGGAELGALLGSVVFPGVGTLVGGVGGAVLGSMGGEKAGDYVFDYFENHSLPEIENNIESFLKKHFSDNNSTSPTKISPSNPTKTVPNMIDESSVQSATSPVVVNNQNNKIGGKSSVIDNTPISARNNNSSIAIPTRRNSVAL